MRSEAGASAPTGLSAGQTQRRPFCTDSPEKLSELFTVAGASLSPSNKINLADYRGFHRHFRSELPSEQHPVVKKPGVLTQEVTDGLRPWSDKKGCGWIADHPMQKTSIWCSVKACGSWRLAFILARLQRSVWQQQSVQLAVGTPSAKSAQATAPHTDTMEKLLAGNGEGKCQPSSAAAPHQAPQKKSRRSTGSVGLVVVERQAPREQVVSSSLTPAELGPAGARPHPAPAGPCWAYQKELKDMQKKRFATRSRQSKLKARKIKASNILDEHCHHLCWCPSRCGFLVTGFPSGTHCCNACDATPGKHGNRCQQKTCAPAASAPASAPLHLVKIC